jgi:hypothetical protein
VYTFKTKKAPKKGAFLLLLFSLRLTDLDNIFGCSTRASLDTPDKNRATRDKLLQSTKLCVVDLALCIHSKPKKPLNRGLSAFVVPLGLEPRLFCTKNRRVTGYTMGQSFPKRGANI